ncbi:MAG: hypothetical protein RI575_02645 [Balneolaceae bacterium]|nr:hypothetical protein [Balneolaceae bacterium]MDR9407596.1 hypothetical protein [Balneolaceae bacterium]
MSTQNLLKIILILVIVAVAGCEFSVDSAKVQDQEQVFTVTDDVVNRIVDHNTAAKSSEVSAGKDATDYLTLDYTIESPVVGGNKTRASHLYLHNNTVYMGYKVYKGDFGGGIDIVNASNGNVLESAYSFQSDVFDVQEVVYDPEEDALYIAGAQPRKSEGAPKSWVIKMDPDDAEIEESVGLSGNVAKSIDVSNFANGEYVYAVSDFDDLYRFDKNLKSEEVLPAGGGIEFRSVGARFQNQVFTLDLKGNVRRVNPSYNGFQWTLDLTNNDEFDTDLGIARLNYFNNNDPNIVLVALNEYGWAALNPAGQTEWVEDNGKYYVSLTGYNNGENGKNKKLYVYAANSSDDGQFIDIYDLPNGFQGKGPDLIESLNLNDFSGLTDAPINHVIATDDHLYVAKGQDGVLIFSIN